MERSTHLWEEYPVTPRNTTESPVLSTNENRLVQTESTPIRLVVPPREARPWLNAWVTNATMNRQTISFIGER